MFCISGSYFYNYEAGSALTLTPDQSVCMVNEYLFLELYYHDITLQPLGPNKMEQQNLLLSSQKTL